MLAFRLAAGLFFVGLLALWIFVPYAFLAWLAIIYLKMSPLIPNTFRDKDINCLIFWIVSPFAIPALALNFALTGYFSAGPM